ncbi:jg14162, partial [Pararge aegeria aegeria]
RDRMQLKKWELLSAHAAADSAERLLISFRKRFQATEDATALSADVTPGFSFHF